MRRSYDSNNGTITWNSELVYDDKRLAFQSEVTALESRISNLESRISNLESSISNLESKISKLESITNKNSSSSVYGVDLCFKASDGIWRKIKPNGQYLTFTEA